MLIGNYCVLNKTPGRWLAGNSTSHATGVGVSAHRTMRGQWNTNGPRRGVHYPDGSIAALKRVGYPVGGYGAVAWMMPYTQGDLSSHSETQGSATGTLAMASGWNLSGLAEGTTPTAEATLQLVVSMVASALGEATTNANLNAALGLSGSAAGVATDSALISALAWAIGQADGTCTATLTSYATGRLYGEVTPFTELSPQGLADAVWSALLSQYPDAGTAGNALSLASSGGVDYSALAAAVLAAAQTTPIHSDVRKVNSYTVTGDGQSGTEWGP